MNWIKCSDKMPEIGQVCIVNHRNNPHFDGAPWYHVVHYGVTVGVTKANRNDKSDPYYEVQWWEGLWYINDECHESEQIYVTEWMPLPEPPTKENGQ
jgi:hypothetical protein